MHVACQAQSLVPDAPLDNGLKDLRTWVPNVMALGGVFPLQGLQHPWMMETSKVLRKEGAGMHFTEVGAPKESGATSSSCMPSSNGI
eukprot:1160379-Pelagomonas_calceolata.AAC.10